MYGLHEITFITLQGKTIQNIYTNYIEYQKTLNRMKHSKKVKVVSYGQA